MLTSDWQRKKKKGTYTNYKYTTVIGGVQDNGVTQTAWVFVAQITILSAERQHKGTAQLLPMMLLNRQDKEEIPWHWFCRLVDKYIVVYLLLCLTYKQIKKKNKGWCEKYFPEDTKIGEIRFMVGSKRKYNP